MPLNFTVNYLSVVVAAIAGFIIGWIWYSALFGKAWMKLSGKSTKEINASKKKGMAGAMIVAFIAQFIMAWVLAVFISATSASGWLEGLGIGFWAWLGFVATIGLGIVLWEGKPMKLFWINSLHWLVVLLIMGSIIGAWM